MRNLTFEQNKALYFSLREQYLSKRPMTEAEERAMWEAWYVLSEKGYKIYRIKTSQLREKNKK